MMGETAQVPSASEKGKEADFSNTHTSKQTCGEALVPMRHSRAGFVLFPLYFILSSGKTVCLF